MAKPFFLLSTVMKVDKIIYNQYLFVHMLGVKWDWPEMLQKIDRTIIVGFLIMRFFKIDIINRNQNIEDENK